jgi:hypothetical protein
LINIQIRNKTLTLRLGDLPPIGFAVDREFGKGSRTQVEAQPRLSHARAVAMTCVEAGRGLIHRRVGTNELPSSRARCDTTVRQAARVGEGARGGIANSIISQRWSVAAVVGARVP